MCYSSCCAHVHELILKFSLKNHCLAHASHEIKKLACSHSANKSVVH